jgi:hypothetical protein
MVSSYVSTPASRTSSQPPASTPMNTSIDSDWSTRRNSGVSTSIIRQVAVASRPSDAISRNSTSASDRTWPPTPSARRKVNATAAKKMMKFPIVTGSTKIDDARGSVMPASQMRSPGRVALTLRLLSGFQKSSSTAPRVLMK